MVTVQMVEGKMDRSPGIEIVETFLIVAEELNFRRSAERMSLDQSALTRRIQKLEQTLGFALFERTTREVSLTPAGQVFYQRNADLLGDYSKAIRDARRVATGKAGLVRIGYMAFAAGSLLPMAVKAFRASRPGVDLSLRYIRTQGQKLALARDEIDIGYLIGPFDHAEFHARPLVRDRLFVVTPPGHPLSRRDAVAPADLAGAPLILGDMAEWDAFRWRLESLFSAEGVALDVSLEASNSLALIGLVATGLGVTLYPGSLVQRLGAQVAARPIDNTDFSVETTLVWKRRNRSGAVLDFVEAAIGSVPAPAPT